MSKNKFAGIVINETLQNADKTSYGTEPLGLEYVLAIAQNEGWEVKLFDNIMYSSLEEMAESIKRFSPTIAGFSVFDNSRNSSLALAKQIKAAGSVILFGGYHPSAVPEIALRPEVDFVIAGEAESVLPSLLKDYKSKAQLAGVKNLAFADEDGNLHLERVVGRSTKPLGLRPIRDEFYLRQKENTMNFPAPSEQTGVAHVIMTRGCTYSCSFCSSSGIYGTQVMRRDIEDALDEIEELAGRDVNLVIIDDLNMTLNKKYVEMFCEGVTKRNLQAKVNFEVFGNISTTTPQMLEQMFAAGVRRIGYGIESLDPEVQKYIGKGVDVPKLRSLLDKAADLGILTSGFYQVGYPTETEESVRKNVQKLVDEKLFAPRLRLVIATPTSGSKWHKALAAQMQGWPAEKDWDRFDTQHMVYAHPHFKEDSLLALRDELQDAYYKSGFYQRSLEALTTKHPELSKSFEESGR
jgi:anaerobic magnesium-protoporphyrin IX monomethyl ester cyclase